MLCNAAFGGGGVFCVSISLLPDETFFLGSTSRVALAPKPSPEKTPDSVDSLALTDSLENTPDFVGSMT